LLFVAAGSILGFERMNLLIRSAWISLLVGTVLTDSGIIFSGSTVSALS